MVVDTCYSIGEAALRKCQYDTATTWLGRALTVCELWPGDGPGLKDKKLLVFHAYGEDVYFQISYESWSNCSSTF